jgi:CRP/FNR family transcriptional regulator
MFCDLSRCFLCTHCIPEWKEVIALRKQTLSFKKGQPIFSEGDPVEGIFFVYSGTVKVHQQWGEEKELILTFSRAGDVLGYRGQAAGVHPVTATPLEATQVCHLPQTLLEATFKANPAFLYQMMQLYAGELQKAERRMRHLALTEVRGRIADALLTIREIFGEGPEGFVSVPITRQDIASYAGTSYETVFKLFTEWTAQGVLDTSGKYIRILDRTRLDVLIPK